MAFVVTVIAVFLAVSGFFAFVVRMRRKPVGRYPFWPISAEEAGPCTADRFVYDRKARKKLLRPQFSAEAVANQKYDAIVIGSGIGGMTAAVLLSKAGQRVLVLEQNAQVGGCCHTFNHKGFEFDVGVHYVGQMGPGQIDHFLMQQVTGGQLEWAPLDPQYDVIVLGEGEKAMRIPVGPSLNDSRAALIQAFPEDKEAVEKFFAFIRSSRGYWLHFIISKVLPAWLARLLASLGVLSRFCGFFKVSQRTLSELLNELTPNPAVRTALAYCFGDYGTLPRHTSCLMQTALWDHFSRGAYYPVGGASEITMTMKTQLEKAGGRLLGKANVSQILCDDTGRVVGVRVLGKPAVKGEAAPEVEVRAPLVVSSAGVLNTSRLLPESALKTSHLPHITNKLSAGLGAVSVFIGLRNSNAALKLKRQSFWVFPHGQHLDHDAAIDRMIGFGSLEALLDADESVLMFASFPSAKDPLWERRCDDGHRATCALITLAPFAWFETWQERKVKKRGAEYEELKKRLAMKMWYQLCSLMPADFEAEADMELLDVGTPLTNNHYIGSTRGEIYGLDHTAERFGAEMSTALRPDVGVPGLLLAGQDVATCGVAGGMLGGVLAASEALNRNLMMDVPKLAKKGFNAKA